MTNRDLVGVAAAVVVLGFVAGAFFFLMRHRLARPVEAPPDASEVADEPTPLPPPLEPEPYDDDTADAHATPSRVATSVPPRAADAAVPAPLTPPRVVDASVPHDSAPPTVVRAQNLLIHSTGQPKLCVDYSSHHDTLHLFACHGKPNQRWTAAEDVGGAIRLMSAQGGCVIAQGATKDGEPGMTLGECGAGALRFKHFEEHRLQETQTGKCVAARRVEKGTRLSLEPCDGSNPGQSWSLQ